MSKEVNIQHSFGGIREFNDDLMFPARAISLAIALGMVTDSYMFGCTDSAGNKLMYLHRNTSIEDIEAFAEMYLDNVRDLTRPTT